MSVHRQGVRQNPREYLFDREFGLRAAPLFWSFLLPPGLGGPVKQLGGAGAGGPGAALLGDFLACLLGPRFTCAVLCCASRGCTS